MGHREKGNNRGFGKPLKNFKFKNPLCFTLGWPCFLLLTPTSTFSQEESPNSILMRAEPYIFMIRENSLIFPWSHWVTFLHYLFVLNAAEKLLCLQLWRSLATGRKDREPEEDSLSCVTWKGAFSDVKGCLASWTWLYRVSSRRT